MAWAGVVRWHMLETLLPLAATHWPFIALAAVLWALGQAGKALAPDASAGPMWKAYRATLPWHPLLMGALVGACFPALAPFASGDARPLAVLYFAASGVLSCYAHDVYQTIVKYKGLPS